MGGGEYLSNEFKNFLVDKGIHHQRTCSYTPQQNGVAERMNRTLKDLVRAMLKHMNIANEFWAEALSTAAYIRNRVNKQKPSKEQDSIPYLVQEGSRPFSPPSVGF